MVFFVCLFVLNRAERSLKFQRITVDSIINLVVDRKFELNQDKKNN